MLGGWSFEKKMVNTRWKYMEKHLLPRSMTVRPWKVSQEKKDRLPTTISQEGELLNFGVYHNYSKYLEVTIKFVLMVQKSSTSQIWFNDSSHYKVSKTSKGWLALGFLPSTVLFHPFFTKVNVYRKASALIDGAGRGFVTGISGISCATLPTCCALARLGRDSTHRSV